MVRFKCRYLLVQLHSFDIGEAEVNPKRMRYTEKKMEKAYGMELKGEEIDGVDDLEEEKQMNSESLEQSSESLDESSESLPHCANLPFSAASVTATLKTEMERNYGIAGGSSFTLGFSVKYTNTATRMIIIRCPRDWVDRLQTSLALLSEFPVICEKPELQALAERIKCTWRVVYCTGTIKACQRAAISFARTQIKEEKLIEEMAKKISLSLE